MRRPGRRRQAVGAGFPAHSASPARPGQMGAGLWALAAVGTAWLPFVIADPGTLHGHPLHHLQPARLGAARAGRHRPTHPLVGPACAALPSAGRSVSSRFSATLARGHPARRRCPRRARPSGAWVLHGWCPGGRAVGHGRQPTTVSGLEPRVVRCPQPGAAAARKMPPCSGISGSASWWLSQLRCCLLGPDRWYPAAAGSSWLAPRRRRR